MGNMSYCRMENTYQDLRDCYDNWDEADSETEKRYRKKILELATEIVDDYGDMEDDDE